MTNPLLNVTDYRKTWVEGYTRQSQQLDRYHKQLSLRDQQEEKAKTVVTPVKMLTQFADTLNKGVTAINKIDEGIGAKVKQKFDKLAVTGEAFDILQLLKKHDGNINEQHKDYTKYVDLINRSNMDVQTIDYLKSLHGRNLYWGKAYAAQKKANNIGILYQNILQYDGKDESILADKAQLVADLAKFEGDHLGQQAVRDQWASKQFGDEFLSDAIIAKFVKPQIDKWNAKTDILNLHESAKISLGRADNQWKQELLAVQHDTELSQTFFKNSIDIEEASIDEGRVEIVDGGVMINGVQQVDGDFVKDGKLNKRAIARKIVLNRIETLAHSDQSIRGDLDRIFSPGGAKGSPQGDSILNFFTEEELKPVFHAHDRATIRALNANVLANEKENENKINAGMANFSGENWNKAAWTKIYNDLLLNEASEDQLNRAKFMMENTNSKASYNSAVGDYQSQVRFDKNGDPIIEAGFLSVDDDVIKAIPNTDYRSLAQQIKGQYFPTYEAAGTSDHIKSEIKDKLEAQGIVFDKTKGYKGEAKVVNQILSDYADKMAIKGIDLGYKGKELNDWVTIELDKFWDINGGGRKTSQWKEKDKWGIFTTDENGNFTRHREARIAKATADFQLDQEQREATVGLTEKDLNIIRADLKKKFFDAGGYLDTAARVKIMGTPESCVTLREFEVMIANGGYSQKLLAQAEVLKVAPGTLFEMQFAALQNAAQGDEEATQALQRILGDQEIEIPDSEADFFKAIADNKYLTQIFTSGNYKYAQMKKRKRLAFAFINDDWDQAELIWPGGIPYRMGFDPRIRREQIVSNQALKALEDK